MQLSFFGAAREVTGSCHMVTTSKGHKILLDCGMFQGHRKESRRKNCELLFDPKEVHNMILSHAHLDHCGRIPFLINNGFDGNIHTTFATRDIAKLMLEDSGHIQEMDEKYIKRQQKKGRMKPMPTCMLYNIEEASQSMKYFSGENYLRPFQICEGIEGTLLDAGHILGSAMVSLNITDKNKKFKLVFTGDLGRKGLPILRDPDPVTEADYLIMESTYGDRLHDDIENVENKLAEVINRTISRKGKIIVPAFALERTQELIYHLHMLVEQKRIPKLEIFVDSPLATNVTEVFQLHPECYDKKIYNEFIQNRLNPFGFGDLTYTRSTEESKALNDKPGPYVIISASGMCEAGRIRHHLKNNIENAANTILVVGYMAQHTLGRKIVEKEPEIKIFDHMYKVNAEVVKINAFSGHADKNDLFNFVKGITGLKKVFLVHGEESNMTTFGERIEKELGLNVYMPTLGETVEVE